jgi:putative oxidoreductase
MILSDYSGWGTVALRIVVGIVFVVHGWPKVKNPSGIAKAVWGGITFIGLLQGLVEFLGGVAVILGLWVAPISLVFAVIMLGAIYFKVFKWKAPFMSTSGPGSWEFDLVLLAAALALALG